MKDGSNEFCCLALVFIALVVIATLWALFGSEIRWLLETLQFPLNIP